MDAPESIVSMVQWAVEEQATLGDDLLPYIRSQVREILLGLEQEEAI
jgi:hypothetical protein